MSAHVQFSRCRHAKTIPAPGSRRSKTCTNPDLTILPARRSMPPPNELPRIQISVFRLGSALLKYSRGSGGCGWQTRLRPSRSAVPDRANRHQTALGGRRHVPPAHLCFEKRHLLWSAFANSGIKPAQDAHQESSTSSNSDTSRGKPQIVLPANVDARYVNFVRSRRVFVPGD
jgi:hypothetical protein